MSFFDNSAEEADDHVCRKAVVNGIDDIDVRAFRFGTMKLHSA